MGNPERNSPSTGEHNSASASTSALSNVPSPPPPSYASVTRTTELRPSTAPVINQPQPAIERRPPEVVQGADQWRRVSEEEMRRAARGTWPHEASSLFACLCCLLGFYNISRFAMLVYIYKGYFIFEFLILTCVLGVPFLYLVITLGQYIGSGMLDMWYISPAFKGIGFAFMYLYAILGLSNTIPISWMFVYFKDSFITATQKYKWGACHNYVPNNKCLQAYNTSSPEYVGWSASSYFHHKVLERPQMTGGFEMGDLRFEIAFNHAILWLLVFITLSRGLRSLGKVVFVLGTLPTALLLLVTIRFLEEWNTSIAELFSEIWRPILTDSSSWLLAAREVMLTWGVYGAALLHLSSHNKLNSKITKKLIILFTVSCFVLILGALLCVSAIQILHERHLTLAPSSFEEERFMNFLQYNRFLSNHFGNSNLTITNLLMGSSISPSTLDGGSGYQVLRLATEIIPAALALEGVKSISSFWSISFYGTVILFSLGQQVTIWFCVVESIIALNPKILRGWQTILTFVTCNIGFLLGLPMTTNAGIYVVFFFDYCIGSLWWIVVLYLLMIVSILFIRGHPYGTDQLVTIATPKAKTRTWLLPILTFQWNVVIPVSFLVLSIAFLKWTPGTGDFSAGERYRYWPTWVKKMAIFMQVCPLLIVAAICAFKAYAYLTPKSDIPLHERIQSWCCPVFASASITQQQTNNASNGQAQTTPGVVNTAYEEDPPPKYTPPPSYSTATSRMIVKQLIRRASNGEIEAARIAGANMGLQSISSASVELVSYDPQPENSEPTSVLP